MRRETLGADGIVVSELMCPRDSEGGPDVAHGGWTAGNYSVAPDDSLIFDNVAVWMVRRLPITFPVPAVARG